MSSLTPQQAGHVLRVLLTQMRDQLQAGPQFTVTNLITLLAVIENPGATQPDIGNLLNTTDWAVLSRQLRYLRGQKTGVVTSPVILVIRMEPLETDNRVNTVQLTAEGQEFASNTAKTLNKLLKVAAK